MILVVMEIGRVGSLWMIDILVGLVWGNAKLASASFAEKQFWTETSWNYFVEQNDAYGADLL